MNLLSALTALANNEFEKPICITLANEGTSIFVQQPMVTVKVCDILGNALTIMPKVMANSVIRVGDDAAILSKQTLQASQTDK